MIRLELKVRLVSLVNQRESRFKASARAAKQRKLAALTLANAKLAQLIPNFPMRIKIYRIGKRKMDTDRPFHVISAYRSPATNAKLLAQGRGVRKNSLHMRGMAIDIRLPGRDTGALWHAAISARRGGTGFYPKYDFVHLDVGPHWHWCKPSRCDGGAPRPG